MSDGFTAPMTRATSRPAASTRAARGSRHAVNRTRRRRAHPVGVATAQSSRRRRGIEPLPLVSELLGEGVLGLLAVNVSDEYRRNMWRGKASAYQRSFASLCAHPVPLLLDALDVTAGDTLLDAGCGTGSLAEVATARGAVVTAVDSELSMVEATAARMPSMSALVCALQCSLSGARRSTRAPRTSS